MIAPRLLQYESVLSQVSPTWHVLLDEPLRAQAQQAALLVAERMRDSHFVSATAEQARQQAAFPTGWFPLSLACGDVGMALMYEHIDTCFPGQGWDRYTQQYLRLAASASQQSSIWSPALFSGTSGLIFALSLASKGGQRYQKTLARLHKGLCDQTFQQVWRRADATSGVADSDYDLISGAAGVLACLVSIKQPDHYIQAAIEHLLEYLIWLAEPGQLPGKERWYIPPELLSTDSHRQAYPQGNFNCGLAHGIPGPLAVLALTWLAGYRYPGLRETISYLANWVVVHRIKTPWGIDWSDSIALASASDPQEWQKLPATRSAWCYGAPGVARSLWLAGQALDDADLRQLAIEALESMVRRPALQRLLFSPTLCHGTAGLLQICLRFAQECESTLVKEQISLFVEQILAVFDPALPLGFRDVDQGVGVDQPAWLTGAPGVALTLLAAALPVAPLWDRALALA